MQRDRIFISYRRTDVPDTVDNLLVAIAQHFGEGAVFQDLADIQPGEEFPRRLHNELARAAFVLVVIGPRWNVPAADARGRLDDEHDWVRIELTIALEDRDIEVIPLLVDGTPMPSPQSLPESVRAMSRRNAVPLQTASIKQDIGPLVTRISERICPIGGNDDRAVLRMALREQVGSMVAAHVWFLWQLLLPHRQERRFSFGPPPGFRTGDLPEMHRVMQWLSDVASTDAGWWRDASILVTADAAVWVASDLMDRLMQPAEGTSDSDALDTMANRRRTTIEKLVDIFNQQIEIGDRTSATDTSTIAKSLQKLDGRPSYLVELDSYTRLDDSVEIIGGRPFGWIREEISWFVDYLRPDPLKVNSFGEPLETKPPPASVYRWGRLLQPHDSPATVWESRFLDNSWFRRVLERAKGEYPSGRLATLLNNET